MESETWIILRGPAETTPEDLFRMSSEEIRGVSIVAEAVPSSAVADLEQDPRTLVAAPDMPTTLVEPFAAPSPASDDAWGVAAVGADASTWDGTGVRMAILDTGIDPDHPAFAGMSLRSRDFTGDGVFDGNGHGTHCAGTAFGRDVGTRIGVARGVQQALIGKVLDNRGSGTSLMAIEGMQWAVGEGANVISMSLGFDIPRMVEQLIAKGWPSKLAAAKGLDAYRRNVRLFDRQLSLIAAQNDMGRSALVVAATGNASLRSTRADFVLPASLPAAADGVVSVAALGRSPQGLRVADFSNSLPTISAPGVDVRSAWPGGGLKSLNGTSMACPHVAGVAALWWQALGSEASAEAVRLQLLMTADRAGLAAGFSHTDVGRGLVRAPA